MAKVVYLTLRRARWTRARHRREVGLSVQFEALANEKKSTCLYTLPGARSKRDALT